MPKTQTELIHDLIEQNTIQQMQNSDIIAENKKCITYLKNVEKKLATFKNVDLSILDVETKRKIQFLTQDNTDKINNNKELLAHNVALTKNIIQSSHPTVNG